MTSPKPLSEYFPDKLPNVWAKGYWGFTPDNWGCVVVTQPGALTTFVQNAQQGDLVLIYATGSREVSEEIKSRALGFYQVDLEERATRDCISDERWQWKLRERPDGWNFAVPSINAWKITQPTGLPFIADVALETKNNSTHIKMATRPVKLTPKDQQRALGLLVESTPVFGQPYDPSSNIDDDSFSSPHLTPSRGVPPYSGPRGWTEASSQKQLYQLKLNCDPAMLLGWSKSTIHGRDIWKVGYSSNPMSRCQHFNNHLPFSNKLRWVLEETSEIYQQAQPAFDAECYLKNKLEKTAKSLGREFYLASEAQMKQVWQDTLQLFPPG